jgi:GTP cyclohydrolase II
MPVDGIDTDRLAAFMALCAPLPPRLIVSARRARTLGLEAAAPMELSLARGMSVEALFALVLDPKVDHVPEVGTAGAAAVAAVQLMKIAQGLPTVLATDATAANVAIFDPPLVTMEAASIARFRTDVVQSIKRVSEAYIPLPSGTRAHFITFSDALKENSLAIIVGELDRSKPVLVRLHSACLTGDVFGSRRCDCGEQLKLALTRLEEAGGGIILYLAQEGRGLGLANKLRAYQLQDVGLDTVDANTTLGFEDDERDYNVAARILDMLGCRRIALLTNNPAKLDGLAKTGIEIAGRIPLEAPITDDNCRYLTAKMVRGGHQLGHLIGSFAKIASLEERLVELAP